MLLYEARQKHNGDYEVWRSIPGSKTSEECIATFHNFLRDIAPTVNIAEINASNFVKEQNEREKLLDEGIKFLHQGMVRIGLDNIAERPKDFKPAPKRSVLREETKVLRKCEDCGGELTYVDQLSGARRCMKCSNKRKFARNSTAYQRPPMTGREIYNQQIAPLMAQIDKIATSNGIAYLAAFQYSEDNVAMSVALKDSTHRSLHEAHSALEQALIWDADELTYTRSV